MTLISLVALVALAPASGSDVELTANHGRPTVVDASSGVVFGMEWRRPVVRTGVFRTVGTSFGTPAVSSANRLVIVGTGEGEVLAFGLDDAQVAWEYAHGRPFETHATIVQFAAKQGEAPQELAILGSRDGWLLALDVATGTLAWRTSLDGDPRAPAVQVGSRVLVTTAVNKVLLVSLRDGSILWTAGRSPPGGLTIAGNARATVAGDAVYATFSDGYAEAYTLSDGAALWSRPLSLKGGDFVDADADPIVAGNTLFAASYSDGIYALDRTNGQTLWTRSAPAVTSLGAHGDTIVAASADGYVWGLRSADGEMLFRTRVPAGPISRIIVRRDLIVLTAGEAGLIVLDARTGRPLQATAFGGDLAGDPAWSQDDMALLSSAGYLYKLRLGFRGRVR